jgi:hypothetical protein
MRRRRSTFSLGLVVAYLGLLALSAVAILGLLGPE